MPLHPDIEGLVGGFYERPDHYSLSVLADRLEEMGHPHADTIRNPGKLKQALTNHLSDDGLGIPKAPPETSGPVNSPKNDSIC